MNEEQKSGHVFNFTGSDANKVALGEGNIIADVIKGQQVSVGGQGNTQNQTVSTAQQQVTETDLAVLRRILDNVKAQVEAEAPPEKKSAALERVAELEEAVTAKEPDLSTMEYIKNWFAKNLPTLSGAVTSVVVHPIVGKIVETAGETLAKDFYSRFCGK